MALNSLFCVDVPLSNYSHSLLLINVISQDRKSTFPGWIPNFRGNPVPLNHAWNKHCVGYTSADVYRSQLIDSAGANNCCVNELGPIFEKS